MARATNVRRKMEPPKARSRRRSRSGFRRVAVVGAVIASMGAGLAQPARADLPVNSALFLDRFAEEIEERLAGNVVGYSYAIAQGGSVQKSGGDGLRRRPPDGTALPFDENTLAQAASTSKTITAAAMLRLLNSKGVSVDSPVEPYLPTCWKRPKLRALNRSKTAERSIENLTFRDLLQHRSRFDEEGDTLASLEKMIMEGRLRKPTPGQDYLNNNYSLMRVLAAFVASPGEMHQAFMLDKCQDTHGDLNQLVSDRFRTMVLSQLLAPIGVIASFYPQGVGLDNWSYNYHFVDDTMAGNPPKEHAHLLAGAGRLAISAVGYARFLSALDEGQILPREPTDLISVEDMIGTPHFRMGFDGSIKGTLGSYVFKNGICPDAEGKKTGCQAAAVMLPYGIQAWVVVNSSANTYDGPIEAVVQEAFDDALT